MIMGRKQWTVAGAMLAVAVSATVGILCARGHVRSRNGPGAEVEHESVEKVTVRAASRANRDERLRRDDSGRPIHLVG